MRSLFLIVALAILPAQGATTYYLTVAGLGGEPDYETRFASLAQDLNKAFAGPGRVVETLSGPKATKTAIKSVLDRFASTAKAEDDLVLVLIGHGTFDGSVYKFNIPGPDVTAEELRGWLDRIPARQMIANLTSSSGASLGILQKEGRIVMTATKSGNERIAVVFSRYFVDSLRDMGADSDKNENISALEAFRFADQKTARFYETQKRVATEHALLEDTGRGEGVRAPGQDNGKGLLAARFPILRVGELQAAMSDPAKQELLARKEELEQQIDALKYRKAAVPSDQYKKQITSLLLELARTQEALDK